MSTSYKLAVVDPMLQAPKATIEPSKLTSVLSYLHQSGRAHSIRDLESTLPLATAIDESQVRDYVTSLTNESKIRTEKVGNCNWYWAFPAEIKHSRETALTRAYEEKNQAQKALHYLQAQLKEAARPRQDQTEDGIQWMRTKQTMLTREVDAIRVELSSYVESPFQMETIKNRVTEAKAEAEEVTDQILAIEGYMRTQLALDRGTLDLVKKEHYGKEYDHEAKELKELCEPA